MTSDPPVLVWFRQDLRLHDHPALIAAAQSGTAVLPVYMAPPSSEETWPPGAASRWWLHQSLQALDHDLRTQYRTPLTLLQGAPDREWPRLIQETGARAVFWNIQYEPAALARDTLLKTRLENEGVTVQTFNGSLLVDPPSFYNQSGKPFQVFTPFWKAASARYAPPIAQPRPRPWPLPDRLPKSLPIQALGLDPRRHWTAGLQAAWQPGEDHARQALDRFFEQAVADYPEDRDRPDRPGVSRLSPHLHFGEISPRFLVQTLHETAVLRSDPGFLRGVECYLRQLFWREFAAYLLYHFPHTPDAPLHPSFHGFPWRNDPAALSAWQQGRTGYPVVDAGMRELWATGWMHNRVRMIVASFLVKDLLIPWQAGARWFWDTLVDADLPNNTLGWQWAAGCGADAAPYFRIFNPVLQGRKFDPDGAYVRRWVPELGRLPDRSIHAPWEAPESVCATAGVVLGETYPLPFVDHAEARQRALLAYERMKGR